MKGITSLCFLLVAVAWLPLRASDGESVVVKSSSVESKLVSLHAELAGKETAFTCVVGSPSCSPVKPGEYIMVRAEAGEGIYNDCTNVVLYKPSPSSGAKEKLGVYCWLNDDCYIVNCTPATVQTIPAGAPNKVRDQSKESPCWKTARAQSEMNRCADLDAREADADLNRVYQELLSKLKSDENATRKVRAAQRAWVVFRDAHLQELYPAQDKQREYGSIYPMCYAQLATGMTKERTAQLRRMLEDKDPCDTSASSGHCKESVATDRCAALVEDALKQLSEVRLGDSRGSLERSFDEDGGLQFAKHSRYVLKKCRFIKVDVDFSGEGIDGRTALPTDRVVRVSRPYLDYPAYD